MTYETTFKMWFKDQHGEKHFTEITADRKYLNELNVLAAIKRPERCVIMSLWSGDTHKTYTDEQNA